MRPTLFALLVVAPALSVPFQLTAQVPVPSDSGQARSRDSSAASVLPPVIITGTRIPAAIPALGFAASVLRQADLLAEPAAYAVTALARLPAVAIEEGAGVGGPTVLRLRGGEEPFTQVLYDGVAINLTGGFMDLQGMTLTNVDRVEVARGAQSAMYGSSAVSGAVQLITRRGRVGPPALFGLVEGGTAAEFGRRARGELGVSGGSRRLQYSTGVGFTHDRGIYALPHDLESRDASLRLDASASPRLTFSGTFRYADVASNLPVRDPGVTRVPLDPNQRDGRKRIITALTTTFSPLPAWQHHLSAKLLRDDFFYEDQPDGLDPADYSFFVFDFDFRQESLLERTTLEYTSTYQVPGPHPSDALVIAYGGKLEREDLQVDQSGDFGDSRVAFDRNNGAAFAEIQGRAGSRLDVLAGVRFEQFQDLASVLLPRAAVAFAAVPDAVSLRLAVGRGFRAPNLQQQFLENPFTEPNPHLEPETSVSWEAGARFTATGLGLVVTGTFFHQAFDNLIRLVPNTAGDRQTNRNLGRSQVRGFEFEIEKSWTPEWRMGANGTWAATRLLNNDGLSPSLYPLDGRLPGAPRVTGNLYLDGQIAPRFGATLRGRYMGSHVQFSERFSGDRLDIAAYFLLGITARVTLNPRISTYVRVENLLNTEYDVAFDRPGRPLTGVFGIRVASR